MIRQIKRMDMQLTILFEQETGEQSETKVSWDSETKHATVDGTLYSSDIWMLNNLVRSLNSRISPPKKRHDNRRNYARQSNH